MISNMSPQKLTFEETATKIGTIPDWKVIRGGKLRRTFKFKDFVEAFAFLTSVALEAEKLGHHPEIRNVYNTVEFILTTHDAGGLTKLDFKLARKIDTLAEKVLA